MSKTIGLIPARMESMRLPGKPLVDICGMPMILHVWQRCRMAQKLDDVAVVTDSDEIRRVVESVGGRVIMTSSHHETGSDRLAEAALHLDHDIVVNIQGDEALVDPVHIDTATDLLASDSEARIGLLVTPYYKRNSPSDIKVVVNLSGDVIYMSRTDIPSDSRQHEPPLLKAYHIVPFRRDFLLKFAELTKGNLEQIEKIEYMRVLEHGYTIVTARVDSAAISVDTVEDLEYVRKTMASDPAFSRYG